MACYSPIRALLRTGADGRRSLAFKRSGYGKGVALPCGRCIGCRLERARQWAVRIVHEAKMHDENCFITLTYDDEHLPKGGTLCVKDCQQFLKRLRARLEPKRIRFFLCGEYGERLGRPHYHAIVFGWMPSDRVRIGGGDELPLWSSRLLSDAWGLGHASVGQVSFDSASYVANYSTKKITGEKAAEHYGGRKPEFLVMSRRPGIGALWFAKFGSDVFPSDEVIVRGQSCRPPRYYDQLKEREDAEFMRGLKDRREVAAAAITEEVWSGGKIVARVLASNSDVRLAVREKVARAKLALKRRSL